MEELIFGALKAVVTGFFGSLFNRLFPPKTAADQRADDEAKTIKADKAELDAAVNHQSSTDSLRTHDF